MFLSIQRRLLWLSCALGVVALLPLTGAVQAQPRNGFRITATMGYQLPGVFRGPPIISVQQALNQNLGLNQGGNLGGNQGGQFGGGQFGGGQFGGGQFGGIGGVGG